MAAPEGAIAKLFPEPHVSRVTVNNTLLGDSWSYAGTHPLLLVVNQDFATFFDTDLFMDQVLESGLELAAPLFKRISSLSKNNYLPRKQQTLRS